VFAALATLVCLGVLVGMAAFRTGAETREAWETTSIITSGVSLVAAWSWEHCFNYAFEIIGVKYQVGYDGLVPKLVLSIIVPAALLPTYLQHVRKRVLEIEEEHHTAQVRASSKESTPAEHGCEDVHRTTQSA